MAPSYPCLQCLFCKHLFATSKSLNSHLDHYLPEYCAATGAVPRRTALDNHPIPAIRYVRAEATRTSQIRWKRDTVRPPDGVLWSFAVPVASKAVKVANDRGGLKTADWWLKFLRAVAVPPGSVGSDLDDDAEDTEDEDEHDDAAMSEPDRARCVPAKATTMAQRTYYAPESSRDGASRGILNKLTGQHGEVTSPRDIATGGGFDANGAGNLTVNIAGKNVSGMPLPAAPAAASQRASEPIIHAARNGKAPVAVIDLTTPPRAPRSPSAWRVKTPPRRTVRFKAARLSSPFLLPSAPPTVFTLRVVFLTEVYAVAVTRGMGLAEVVTRLMAMDGTFDRAMWDRLGLAPKASGVLWTAEEWVGLKSAAMFAEGEVLVEAVVVKKAK